MAWLYLAIAIVAEVVATSFLRASASFTKPLPSLVVVVGYGCAFYFLSLTLDKIPADLRPKVDEITKSISLFRRMPTLKSKPTCGGSSPGTYCGRSIRPGMSPMRGSSRTSRPIAASWTAARLRSARSS